MTNKLIYKKCNNKKEETMLGAQTMTKYDKWSCVLNNQWLWENNSTTTGEGGRRAND